MDDCKKTEEKVGFVARLRSFLPTIIPIAIIILAGGTDVLGTQVRDLLMKSLHDRLVEFLPYLYNFLFAIALLNLGWVLRNRCCKGVNAVLERHNASAPMTNLVSEAFKIAYWAFFLFAAAACFSPDFVAKVVAGAGLITAGLTVALQGIIADYIAGRLLPGTEFVKEGADLKVNDVANADGKVVKLGYVRLTIDTKEHGRMSVPNSKVWSSSLAQKKPKSSIILPEDYGKGKEKEKQAPAADKPKATA